MEQDLFTKAKDTLKSATRKGKNVAIGALLVTSGMANADIQKEQQNGHIEAPIFNNSAFTAKQIEQIPKLPKFQANVKQYSKDLKNANSWYNESKVLKDESSFNVFAEMKKIQNEGARSLNSNGGCNPVETTAFKEVMDKATKGIPEFKDKRVTATAYSTAFQDAFADKKATKESLHQYELNNPANKPIKILGEVRDNIGDYEQDRKKNPSPARKATKQAHEKYYETHTWIKNNPTTAKEQKLTLPSEAMLCRDIKENSLATLKKAGTSKENIANANTAMHAGERQANNVHEFRKHTEGVEDYFLDINKKEQQANAPKINTSSKNKITAFREKVTKTNENNQKSIPSVSTQLVKPDLFTKAKNTLKSATKRGKVVAIGSLLITSGMATASPDKGVSPNTNEVEYTYTTQATLKFGEAKTKADRGITLNAEQLKGRQADKEFLAKQAQEKKDYQVRTQGANGTISSLIEGQLLDKKHNTQLEDRVNKIASKEIDRILGKIEDNPKQIEEVCAALKLGKNDNSKSLSDRREHIENTIDHFIEKYDKEKTTNHPSNNNKNGFSLTNNKINAITAAENKNKTKASLNKKEANKLYTK